MPERDINKVTNRPTQQTAKVAIITGDNVEDTEFFYPYYRFAEAGYEVDIFTENGGKFAGKHGIELQDSQPIANANPADYALLYLPGGKAPSELRDNADVRKFVQAFAQSGKPIAAVCHGPQILASAGLLKGKRVAAWPALETEMENAGGTFVDASLVEDGQIITARMPGDLPHHLSATLRALETSAVMQKAA